MDIAKLIEYLSLPDAYPYSVAKVEVRQTHISAVFLTDEFVYKLKKPVNPGFLDFRTLEQRRHCCDEEVRLNRRLAPQVYLGVVPVVQTPDGCRFEHKGTPIEWAVKMRRLPDSATLLQKLLQEKVDAALVRSLAGRIAAFHHSAARTDSAFGSYEKVSRTTLEIFDEAVKSVGTTVSDTVFAKTKRLTEQVLAARRNAIERRAANGMIRDCHGDMHLDHIYVFPDRAAPDDLVIIDCIEFNERFRKIDPVADMAFPTMDFAFHGRYDLARIFAETYFEASGDNEGKALLPLYVSQRAAVRGLVEGLLLAEAEASDADRAEALQKARANWLLAFAVVSEPAQRPCLVLVAGLPGAGKSTVARELAARANFQVIRSDVIRKELASERSLQEDLYSPESVRQTYEACRQRAEQLLFQGHRVIVDATFREERTREMFIETAKRWSVPACILLCEADREVTQTRLAQRRGDASDADWSVYLEMAQNWEPFGARSGAMVHPIKTNAGRERAVAQAVAVLVDLDLLASRAA